MKRSSEIKPAKRAAVSKLVVLLEYRTEEKPFEFAIENVVEPGLTVPRPAMKIPKLLIGELNVNVTSEGLIATMLSPSMAITLLVPQKPGMQESDPLHETT